MKKLQLLFSLALLTIATCLLFTSCVVYKGGGSDKENGDEQSGTTGEVDAGATEDILYALSADGTYAKVVGYKGKINHLVISSTFNGLPVKEIADEAFAGRKTLISVSIPQSVVTIGSKAFRGCEWLEQINIPEGVVFIDANAFDGCKLLETVYFPESLVSIGADAFADCTKLKSLYVKNVDIWCRTSLGSSTSSPLYYATNLYVDGDSARVVELEYGITSISEYSLNCTNLEKLILPSSVKYIAKGAFSRASSLRELSVPFVGGSADDDAYLGYIFGADGFVDNGIYVPSTLSSVTVTGNAPIGEGAFYNCYKLERIIFNGAPTAVEANAFAYCTSLSELYLPKSVTRIAQGALNGATALSSLTLPFVGGGTYGGDYFGYILGASSAADTDVNFPYTLNYVKILGGQSLGASAFTGCIYITELYISSSTTSIAQGALSGLTSLTTLTIPFVGSSATSPSFIGYAFGASSYSENASFVPSSLKTITVTGASSIADNAFLGCTGLTEVSIPVSITSIGQNAFKGCTALSSITIPYATTLIGSSAFAGCSSLKIKCMVSSKPYSWSSTWNPDGRPVKWNETYYGVTEDGFSYCQYATNVIITGYSGNMTDITIPSSIGGYSVIAIGDNAFKDDTTIKSLYIPSTVSSIGANSFYGCTSLGTVYLSEGIQTIQDCAFYGCGITEITIPASVRTLGVSAISYCINLSKVVFKNGSLLTTVNELAFRGDNAIDSVHIADLSAWCKISFGSDDANPLLYARNIYVNGNLARCIVIPEGTTSIGSYCFEGSAYSAVVLPSSLTTINAYAFNNSSYLTAVVIPSSVSVIGDYAFFGCSRLSIYCMAASEGGSWSSGWNFTNRPVTYGCTDSAITNGIVWVNVNGSVTVAGYSAEGSIVVIPSTLGGAMVTAIANHAFRDAASITSITVPASVKSIGSYAFSGCTELKSITMLDSYGWFYSSSASATSGSALVQSDMSDPEIAAAYLTSTYTTKYIKKN